MMFKCCRIYGKLVYLFISLSSAVLFCASCSTNTFYTETNEIIPAADTPKDGGRNISAEENAAWNDSQESLTSVGEKEQNTTTPDMMEKVRQLWYTGNYDEARSCFDLNPDIKDDEWRHWRGRLFIKQWGGSELGLAGENISALLSDNDDIWAGTWTGGLVRYSEPLGTFTVWDPGLPSLAVRTVNRILSDEKRIRIVRYASIENYDKRTGEWSAETDLPAADRLQDLCIIGNKTYLATLGYGLWEKEARGWKRIEFPGLFINRLEKGADNELLIATMNRGLYLFDTESENWTQPPQGTLRESNITSLIRSGVNIIGGTYGDGAFIWNTLSSEVRIFTKNVLGDPWILSVIADENITVFGTFGAGLNIRNAESGEWDRISLPEGLVSADIASMTEDEAGNIWAGTLGGGIIRVSGSIYGD